MNDNEFFKWINSMLEGDDYAEYIPNVIAQQKARLVIKQEDLRGPTPRLVIYDELADEVNRRIEKQHIIVEML